MTSTPAELSALLNSSFLKCPLCCDVYQCPILLPCLHCMCAGCFEAYVEKFTVCDPNKPDMERGQRPTFDCPVCKAGWPLPNKDQSVAPSNSFLRSLSELCDCHNDLPKPCDYCGGGVIAKCRCIDCEDNICESCAAAHSRTKLTRCHRVVPLSEVRAGRFDSDIRAVQTVRCSDHCEPLTLHCRDCDVPVCRECRVGTHACHTVCDAASVAERGRAQMTALLNTVDEKAPTVEQYAALLRSYCGDVAQTRERACLAVRARATALHRLIDRQQDSLLAAVSRAADREQSRIADRQVQADSALRQLRSASCFVRQLLRHGKPEELVEARCTVTRRLQEATASNADPMLTKLSVYFTPGSSSVDTIACVFGRLDVYNVAFTCDALSSKPPAVAGPARRCSTPAPVRCPPPCAPLPCAPPPCPPLPCPPSPRCAPVCPPPSRCAPVCPPPRCAPVCPSRCVPAGAACPAPCPSPCSPLALPPAVTLVQSFKCSGRRDAREPWPCGIDIDRCGSLVIVDRDNGCVKTFSADGCLQSEFGQCLDCPSDLAVLPNGNVAVSDDQRVSVFTSAGDCVAAVAQRCVRGLAVDCRGRLLAVHPQRKLLVYNGATLAVESAVDGKADDGSDSLVDPSYVCATSSGLIVVTDCAPPAVRIFEAGGRRIAHYGTTSELPQPHGVCADVVGNIFVVDNKNDRVHMLTADGKFCGYVITREHGLCNPLAITVAGRGYLAVTEALGMIKIFKYS